MKRSTKRSRVLVVFGVLFVGVLIAPAVLAAEADQSPNPVEPIQSFQSLSTFSEAIHVRQTISFDELETGASVGNPASLGRVEVLHSAAATFMTVGFPFTPVSSPNVLAPFRSDGTFESGDTTLSFARNTRAAGLSLIIPAGSNEETIWTSSVVVTDVKHNSLAVVVSFQGVIGEQQFIGFRSRHRLDTISFGPASRADAFTVVALDDLAVD